MNESERNFDDVSATTNAPCELAQSADEAGNVGGTYPATPHLTVGAALSKMGFSRRDSERFEMAFAA